MCQLVLNQQDRVVAFENINKEIMLAFACPEPK
jgi:hypothetical protein